MKKIAKIFNVVFAIVGFALAALALVWNCTACAGAAVDIDKSYELIVFLKLIAYLLMPVTAILSNKKMNEADSKKDVFLFEIVRLGIAAIMLIVVVIGLIVGYVELGTVWFFIPMIVGNIISPVITILIPAENFQKRRI